MKRETKLLLVTAVALVAILSIGGGFFAPVAHANAIISTDKADYSPGDTVQISGSGFAPSTTISITVTRPTGTIDNCSAGGRFTLGCPTSDSSGSFQTPYQLDGDYGEYFVSAPPAATISFTDGLSVDFRQCANNDSPTPLNSCHWINGILQNSNSRYAEGMVVAQRLELDGIPAASDNVHSLSFSVEFTKGGVHAYDFLTAWNQSNVPGLTMNPCGPGQGNTPDFATICNSLHAAGNTRLVDVPDDSFISANAQTADHTVQTRINAYETAFGNRQIKMYGSSAITAASLTLSHDVANNGDTGDSFINYVLTWTSPSTQLDVEFAGHLAVSGNFLISQIDWGAGFGAGSISGGPYHFKLNELDTPNAAKPADRVITFGSQDNQIQTGTISPVIVNVTCTPSKGTTNKPITCKATASGGTPGYTFSFSAPGGSPSSGTGSCATNGCSVTFTTSYSTTGSKTITVTLTDAAGATDTQSVTFMVNPQPKTLTVTCGNPTAGKPVTCNASSQGGTTPITFSWSAPGGSPSTGSGTSFTTTFPTKGPANINVTQTDGDGLVVSRVVALNVAPQPLVVSVSCGTGQTAGKPFTCTVSATGGTIPYTGTGSFSRTEPVKGTFTETFSVTDANHVTASGSASVIVVQQPFVVSVTCSGPFTAGKPFNCTVSASGGTSPYFGTGTFTVTQPVKGTFTESFTVRDANGKSAIATTSVTVAQQPFVVSVTCGTGQTAGKPFSCTVSASGGTAPYGGTGTFSVTEPVKGSFTERFNVNDANGKTAVASVQVTVVQQPFVATVSCGPSIPTGQTTAGKPFTCHVSATGGTAPYQGTGDFTVTQPVKGTFTESFTVRDANGKTAIASTTVTVVQQPFVVSVSCGSGQTAGKPFTCTVSATGGTAPYTGTGDFVVTQPVKGTFTESFLVKDANGKTATASTQVTVVQQPFVATVSCGASIPTGQITAGKPFTCHVSATGGSTPYLGTGDFTVTQPVKGTFTESFTVRDANGKSAIATTSVTVIQQPFIVSVNCGTGQTAGKPFSCTVSASGGTQPYNGTGTFSVTEPVKGSFTERFDVNDANGKTAVASTTVTVVQQPFVATVSCGPSTPAGQTTAGKPFTCVVSATGGTGPYHGTGSFTVTEPVKGSFTESFTVTDANGKSAIASAHVTVVQQPFIVSVTCGTTAPITAGKPFTCSVSASGGTQPYSGTGDFTVTEAIKGSFTESFTVKDANGKSAIASTQVTVVQQPFVASVTCGNTGPITSGKPFTCVVSATGGTGPYQGTGIFTVTEPVKGTFTESFTVSDANGKSSVASTTVTVVQQPFVVSVSCGSGQTAGKPFTCTVSASGGTAPYQGTGIFTVTEPVKGTFHESFNVKDANGKTAVATTTVTVVQQPFVVSVSCGPSIPTGQITAGKPFTCHVSATGGTAPYQGTGDFVVTEPVKGSFHESFDVTDANGKTSTATTTVTVVQQPFVVSVSCGSSIPTGQVTAGKPFSCTVSATGGTAPYQGTGTFTVTEPVKGSFHESFDVRDANGKTAVATTTVNVVQQPFVVTVNCGSSIPTGQITAGKPFSCTVSATGGTAPYQGTGTFTVTEPVKGTFHESFDVKDANGKTAVATTTVTVVQQPFVVSVSCGSASAAITAGKPFSCTVSATGGTAPYQGTGTFTVTEPVKGTFTESFNVKDANGKSAIASAQVTVVQQPFVVSVTCGPSVPTGQITAGKPFTCIVSATGGTAPYQGTGSFVVTEPVKGSFVERFPVSDSNGKTAVASAQVTVVQQPFVVSVSCGSASAAITAGKPFSCTVSATGGTAPYQGTGTFSVTEPVKGTFTESFDVKDANGKTAIASTQVTVVQQPFVVSVTCGSATAAITAGKPFDCIVSATGGTAPYQGTGKFTLTEPVKGTFHESFNVKDANGKTAVATTTVTVAQQPFVVSVTCGPSIPTGQVTAGKPFTCTVSATGGTQPYSGAGDFVLVEPVKGVFHESFDVKDANGKTAVATTTVTVVQQPFVVSASCGSSAAPITAGKPFSCTVSATGGTAPYQGTGTFTVTEPVKGTFHESFDVKDANGKTAIATTTVTVTQQPFVVSVACGSSTAVLTAGKPFTCTVSATGGTGPYTGTGDFTITEPVKGSFTESFTVTDANGKSAIASTTVHIVQQPFVVSVSCGSASAAITAGKPFSCTVSATGGTQPYSGTGTFQVTEPVKGTFTESFTVTDANGKTAVASTQVHVVQQPFVVSVNCGSAGTPITAGKPFTCTVTATGGTGPYQGTGTFTITQPVKGTFTESFDVKDANSKTAVASTQVTVIQQPFIVSVSCGSAGTPVTAGKPLTCTVSATGGTAPYQGTGSFTVTEPVKGTFTESFAVSDSNGKTAVASTQVTVVQQPFVVSVTCGSAAPITAGKPFSCTVSATGGTAPYHGTGTFTVTEPVKGTFHESFQVRDANGKTAVATAIVTVVQQPFVVDVTCGSATAAITAGKPFTCTVSATGGTGPYQGTGDFQITEPVKGTFTESFTVTDANSKTAVSSTQVTVVQQPFLVSVTCGSSSAAITAGKPFTCTVSASGGTGPYHGTGSFQVTEAVKGTFTERFTVTDANGKSAVASTQVTVVQQPFVASVTCAPAVTAGKPFDCSVSATGGTAPYHGTGDFTIAEPVKGTFTESFTVADSNGKTAVASAQVTVVQQPFVTSVTCGSTSTAITAGKPFSCTVSATGGTAPYHGTGIFTITEPVKGTFTESFTVGDANGKSATASVLVTVVQQPFVVTATCGSAAPITAGKPFTCTVSATGGTSPYTGTGTFTVTQPVKGTFTESFDVKDANGKTAVASTQVTVVQQPFLVSVTCGSSSAAITAGKPFTCTVSATGGTGPYTGTGDFTITEPVKGSFTESFTVTDANGKSAVASTQVTVVQQPFVVGVTCGSSSAAITAGKPFTCIVSATGGTAPYRGTGSFQITEPIKGTFTESFTVTDANGKSAIASTQVTVVQQPFIVSVTCGSTSAAITAGKPFTCAVSATGGTAPYQGTGSFSLTEPVKGTFLESFTVSDSNAKTAVASTQVTVVQQPFVVSVTCGSAAPITAGKPFSCTVSATGGTGPYTGTGTFQRVEPVKGTFHESFAVSDANGKTAVATTTVNVVQQPFVVSVTCSSSSSTITAGKPFTCTVSATGGTGPYRGTGSFTVTQPVKGTFTESFTVTDANGKSAIATTTVTVVQQPFVVSVTCGSGGQITAGKPFTCTVSATGGTGPYTGTGTFTITQPVKGTFTESFNVKDANGKTAVASTTVTVVQQPFIGSVTCQGPFTAGKPFNCTVSATGGTGPYQGTGTFTITQPVKGTFTESFTVSDANGKSVTASTTVIVQPQPLVASFTSVCSGAATVFTATVSGGTTPYSFSWSFGDSTTGTGNPVSHTYGTSGTFTVTLTVTDANGARTTVTHTASGCGQPVVVTDTSFCRLPNNNFVLIFITDPQAPSGYRLVASNPGQFYDNVFYSAAPGSPVTLNIQVPYPFITNGAFPIQISTGFSLTSQGCFVPNFANPSGFTITAPGPLSPSGHPTIVLSNYSPQNFGSTVTVTVTGTVPSTGLVYVTIHLDYGLKGTTGWLKGVAQGSSFQATNSGLGLALNNGQSYAFSVSGSESFTTSVTSSNVFKKDPGVAGVVTDSLGNPIAGATVKVYDNNGMLLGITTTDQNGVYLYFYKYTGSKVNYTVKAILPSGVVQTITVQMQSNKLVLQNFTF